MLPSSHSKPETTTVISYQVVYTKRYSASGVRVIELHLVSLGFDVDKAATAEEGLKIVDRADLVLTDFKLPNMGGLQLLGLIRRQNAQVPVVVMTACGSIETAVESRSEERRVGKECRSRWS